MKNFLAIPTWLLVRSMVPILPKTHAWSGRKFTLTDWADHATEVTRQFDIALWISFPCAIIALVYMWNMS